MRPFSPNLPHPPSTLSLPPLPSPSQLAINNACGRTVCEPQRRSSHRQSPFRGRHSFQRGRHSFSSGSSNGNSSCGSSAYPQHRMMGSDGYRGRSSSGGLGYDASGGGPGNDASGGGGGISPVHSGGGSSGPLFKLEADVLVRQRWTYSGCLESAAAAAATASFSSDPTVPLSPTRLATQRGRGATSVGSLLSSMGRHSPTHSVGSLLGSMPALSHYSSAAPPLQRYNSVPATATRLASPMLIKAMEQAQRLDQLDQLDRLELNGDGHQADRGPLPLLVPHGSMDDDAAAKLALASHSTLGSDAPHSLAPAADTLGVARSSFDELRQAYGL